MSTQQNNNEEIDLGSLFVIIGRGFSKLFNFIGNIFKEIYHFLILIILFFKEHIKKIIIAAFIGGILGTVLEFNKEVYYSSDLLVQPNFKSGIQLYNNINYYNDLVKQNDSILLAATFNISTAEAASLRSFKIEPIKKETDILSLYDEFVTSIDTLSVKDYSFSQFKKAFTVHDYKIHVIHVEATKNNVFSNLDDVIISAIVENQYFKRLKTLTNKNLKRSDSLLRENLNQVDSLRKVYMKVLLDEAKKESNGTSIDVGSQQRSTKELELFETNREINKDLKEISEEISEKSEAINIISNFQPVGYEIKGIERNYTFLFAAVAGILMILFLLLRSLNNYLNTYKK